MAQSQWGEWDRQNVIITGSSDGVVRMWSLDYVEVKHCFRNSNTFHNTTIVLQVPVEGTAPPAPSSPEPYSEVQLILSKLPPLHLLLC